MPTLVCNLPSATPLERLMPGLRALHRSGEALVLWAPGASAPAGTVTVCDREALERAWEDERMPFVTGSAALPIPPAWLPVAECERVLVIVAEAPVPAGNLRFAEWRRAGTDPAGVAGLVAALFAAGCEAVELLGADDCDALHQSWRSGRRAGLRLTALS